MRISDWSSDVCSSDLLIALVGALITPLGVMLAHRLPAAPLALLFSLVLLYVAQRMFREAASDDHGAERAPPCGVDPTTGRLRWTWRCMMHMGSAGDHRQDRKSVV